jgi:hypothetical protein
MSLHRRLHSVTAKARGGLAQTRRKPPPLLCLRQSNILHVLYKCATIRLFFAHTQPNTVWAFGGKSFPPVKAVTHHLFVCQPLTRVAFACLIRRMRSARLNRTSGSDGAVAKLPQAGPFRSALARSPRIHAWGVATKPIGSRPQRKGTIETPLK